MRSLRLLATALTALTLAGCALGPRYQRPTLPLPPSYSEPATEQPIPDAWWALFEDPVLDHLVAEALVANQDLALAVARVEEARALAGLADAERWAEVSLSVEASRSKQSADAALLPPGFPLERSRFRLAPTLRAELDLAGARRNELAASVNLFKALGGGWEHVS